VVGVASVLGITEVVHKLSIIELSSKLKKKPQSIVSLIKNDPSILDKLETPFIAAQNILSMNLEIINLIIPRLIDALKLMKSYRLLSNDAIHVATMKARGISNIATNDPDFERVDWLTVWKP
jgi:predicted nucleic acid-binding protein